MEGHPSDSVKKSANIKSRWNGEIVIIGNCAEVIKDEPCYNSHKDIRQDKPTDMYAGLFQY